MSLVNIKTEVVCDNHIGWLTPVEKKYGMTRRDDVVKYLLKVRYKPTKISPDVFRRGEKFARIHFINDWKYKTELNTKIQDGKKVKRTKTIYGDRFYTKEVFVSNWTVS